MASKPGGLPDATQLGKIRCVERPMSSVMERVDRLTWPAGRNRLELLLFRCSDRQIFGINVFKVREVLKCPTLRSIPHSHHHVRGVMHTRGQAITSI
jgi:two-component system chemotaxis response regulator CheV